MTLNNGAGVSAPKFALVKTIPYLNAREVALESYPEEEARGDDLEVAEDLVGGCVHVCHGIELHIVVAVPSCRHPERQSS
jgi:hypothetical protein